MVDRLVGDIESLLDLTEGEEAKDDGYDYYCYTSQLEHSCDNPITSRLVEYKWKGGRGRI